MTTHETIERLISTWNQHDIDNLLVFYASDFEGHDIGQQHIYRGINGARQMAANYLGAFPDLAFTIDDILVENDCASIAWVCSGTHLGKIMKIPPTGRRIKVNGMAHLTLKDNQIIRSAVLWDVAALLRNIGLLPDL